MDATIRRIAQHAILFCAMRQEALEDALEQAIGQYRYDADTREHRCTFSSDEGTVLARVESVASIAVNPATLLWAWSELLKDSGGTNDASLHIRSVGERQSIAALTTEEVPYPLGDNQDQAAVITALAHDIGMLAVELCGPHTFYYPISVPSGTTLVVLLSNLTIPVPLFSLDDFLIRLARILSSGLVDDFDWSAEGLARLRGWQCERRNDGGATTHYTLTDENGRSRSLGVTFDEHNRVTHVDTTIGGN